VNKSNSRISLILTYFVWFALFPLNAHAAGSSIAANKVGDVLTNVYVNMASIPSFLVAMAYIGGLILAFNAIMGFKDHVDNPEKNSLKVPYVKFICAGMLFSLPYLSNVVVNSLLAGGGEEITAGGRNNAAVGEEVDGMIYNFIVNIHGPMLHLITGFAYVSAIVFLIIGINKLVKMSSEGFKGVPPISVIGNFVVCGALFAFGDMAGTFSTSMFGDATVKTYSVISADVMANTDDALRIATVIDALMAFVALVGFIAFLRGWFVLKAVADGGGGKASMSQALTFLIGGIFAINLGELLNILQTTMGINPEDTLSFTSGG